MATGNHEGLLLLASIAQSATAIARASYLNSIDLDVMVPKGTLLYSLAMRAAGDADNKKKWHEEYNEALKKNQEGTD
jgi:hypothetical protein